MSDEGNQSHHDDCKGHDDQSHGPGKQGHEGQVGHSDKGHEHGHEDTSHGGKCQESQTHGGPKGQIPEGHAHHGHDGKRSHGHEGHGNDVEGHEHDHKLMDAETYSEYWKSDDVIIKEPHECLIKYQDNILGDNMECLKILVPLCGRVFEMKYFADLGHEVVGVEFAEIAIQQFFKIFDIKYETKRLEEPACIVYTSADDMLNIRIYCCDIFQFGPHLEKDFHAVWDSGAMHSLPKEQMMDYVKIMKSVQDPKCKSLVEFTHPSCSGSVSAAELQSMYGEDYAVKELGYTKTTSKHYLDFDIEGFYMYLVSPRG